MRVWFDHWIVSDFWNPVWPNLAAGAMCAPWVVRWMKRRLAKHHHPLNARLERLERRLDVVLNEDLREPEQN